MKSILPLILIALSVTIYFTYIQNQIDVVKDLRTTHQSYVDAVAQTEEIAILRQNLVSKVKSFDETSLDRLKKSVPEKFDLLTFINDLNGFGARNGFILKDITVDSDNTNASKQETPIESPKSPYSKTISLKTYNASFSFKSDYRTMIKFAKEIEGSLRLIDVVSINLKTGDSKEEGGGDIYDFAFKVKTYALK